LEEIIDLIKRTRWNKNLKLARIAT
jgi:hypothetical protein